MGLLDAFADPQFRKDVVRGLLDAGNRGAVAGLLGGPVDLATMAMRPFGYNVEQPVGGSEWIGQKMQNAGFVSPERNRLAEALAGVAIPAAANRLAPTLFAAEQKAAQNLAAPNRMNAATRGQAGAIVWHGSPHKFDKFDSSKIGTGEGAQAYGHGLYLAESPDVARGYKEALSEPEIFLKGRQVTTQSGSPMDTAKAWLQDVYDKGFFSSATANPFEQAMRNVQASPVPNKEAVIAAIEKLKQSGVSMNKGGSLYKVDLPDDQIARMLDWDKPLSQQAPAVQAAYKKYLKSPQASEYAKSWTRYKDGMRLDQAEPLLKNPGGENLYKNAFPSREAANQWAFENGIPGIRYLDGGSRGAGTGTSNFVVFPGQENILRILERNGVPLP
jgi:hypothetical protein